MKKVITLFFTVMIYAFCMSSNLMAQCAMCRASLENNVSEGESVSLAAKLNFGILYLFAMPYLVAMIIGYLWYKKAKAQRKINLE